MTRSSNPRGQGARLRDELVAAAERSLVSARELDLPSLRAIARDVGIAPSAVYLHFGSVAEIVDAVVAEGFAELRAQVDTGGDDLGDRAAAYVRWAIENPGRYQLLFESADRLGSMAPGAPRPGWEMIDDLAAIVGRTTRVDDPGATAVAIWTALHGVASLRIHKPDLVWPESAEDAGRAMVGVITSR